MLKDLQESEENLKNNESELQSELQRIKQKLDVEKASLRFEIESLQAENEKATSKIDALASELQEEKVANSRPVASGLQPLSDIPEHDTELNPVTPENSPPQSPIKGTPSRHGHLETETMRASLSHAQRHIANLKSTVQRQRVESRDLKRRLAESEDKEDWITENRSSQKSTKVGKRKTNAHAKKNSRDIMRTDRRPRSEIESVESEASDWEGDNFQTAGETEGFETARETDVFETANDLTATEPENTGNETEYYKTGEESLMTDSSDDTETEANAVRNRAIQLLENDSDEYDLEMAHVQSEMNERLLSRNVFGKRPTSMVMNVAPKSLYEEIKMVTKEPSEVETVKMCDVGVMTSLIEAHIETRDTGMMTESIVRTISVKSSVSSFASEVDERFHLKQSLLAPYTGTMDPPLVRAVTQTMIGEYLWKYTRNPGRSSLSENRHRRFFWLHPYTRTLYWSVVDPSTPGQSDTKARSGMHFTCLQTNIVSIKTMTVVEDRNISPPGLHQLSLIIDTPTRSLKITAPTGQRHEMWTKVFKHVRSFKLTIVSETFIDQRGASFQESDNVQSCRPNDAEIENERNHG